MKLQSIKEASPLAQYPLSKEVFLRVKKIHPNITQEDIGKFAAWLEVEINGLGRSDLKRLVWEGIKGLKNDPQGVEKVFQDFLETFYDDVDAQNPSRWSEREEARDAAFDELVDDFNRFK